MAVDEAPPFWWEPPGLQAYLFSPAALIYGRVAALRMQQAPSYHAKVPVLCVGNFLAGGAGKTPTVLMFAQYLKKRGLKPGILSRGHGGAITTPTVVKPEHHNAHDVGDEALLHAAQFTTVVSADRPRGAELLQENGCDFIIMDDGFQNPTLHKDFNLVVVDAKRGLGNGFAIPAGPLRTQLKHQIGLMDALLVIGSEENSIPAVRKAAKAGKPIFEAAIVPQVKTKFRGKPVLAFSGIADPEKFFLTLEDVGAKVIDRAPFGDHHVFSEENCIDLMSRADEQELMLVTTTKDHIRLRNMGKRQGELYEKSIQFKIDLKPDDPAMLQRVVDAAVSKFEQRQLSIAS